MRSRGAAVAFGVANVVTALLVGLGVLLALPARWWPVDVGAGLVALLQLVAGVALLARAPWAERVARISSGVTLALGALTVSLLAMTAGWLGGVYGPVGRGGSIILALVAALALPYTVVLPAAQLVWLRPRAR